MKQKNGAKKRPPVFNSACLLTIIFVDWVLRGVVDRSLKVYA